MNTTAAHTKTNNVNSRGRFTVSTTANYNITIKLGPIQFVDTNGGRFSVALYNADTGIAVNNALLAGVNVMTRMGDNGISTFIV